MTQTKDGVATKTDLANKAKTDQANKIAGENAAKTKTDLTTDKDKKHVVPGTTDAAKDVAKSTQKMKEMAVTVNGLCTPCTKKLVHCQECKTDKCSKCEKGTWLHPVTNKCVKVCEKGRYEDSETSKITGLCSECHGHCAECTGKEVHNCQACVTGYWHEKASQKCSKCDTACKTCTGGMYDQCLTCEKGFFKSGKSACVAATKCPSAHFANTVTMTCDACPTGCTNCVSATECTSCKSGYQLPFVMKKVPLTRRVRLLIAKLGGKLD